jgi:hypothetical protein
VDSFVRRYKRVNWVGSQIEIVLRFQSRIKYLILGSCTVQAMGVIVLADL